MPGLALKHCLKEGDFRIPICQTRKLRLREVKSPPPHLPHTTGEQQSPLGNPQLLLLHGPWWLPCREGGPGLAPRCSHQPQALEPWAAMLGPTPTLVNTGSVKGLINFLFQGGGWIMSFKQHVIPQGGHTAKEYKPKN